MAVVADSHRSFLIPEQRRPQSQMTLRGMPDNEFFIRWAVLFFCVYMIITQFIPKIKSFR